MRLLFTGLSLLLVTTQVQAAGAVSPYAYELFRIPGFGNGIPITNSLVMLWVVTLLVILMVRITLRNQSLVPTHGQAVLEIIVETVEGLIEPIVGKKLVRPTFWLLASYFFLILIHNWSALLPGVGTVGIMDEHGHFIYFLRPANADLNTTLALAIIAKIAWLYYVLKYAGLKVLLLDLFGNKASKKEVGAVVWLLLFPIFFAVG
jgi:F-type H+-transporting ATPase subunit a